MTAIKAEGFAVVHDGKLLVNTVSATRRGAILNWLMYFDGVTAVFSDQIEEMWDRAPQGDGRQLECVECVIVATP